MKKILLLALLLLPFTACRNNAPKDNAADTAKSTTQSENVPADSLTQSAEATQPTEAAQAAEHKNKKHGTADYHNLRFNFNLTYPDWLQPQGESMNGDGNIFLSADQKIELRAYAMYNVDEKKGPDLNQVKEYLQDEGSTISYSRVKGNTLIVSGYTAEGRIFYQKQVYVLTEEQKAGDIPDIVATAVVTYEKSEQQRADEVIRYLKTFP